MNLYFILAISLAAGLYILLNYYIGRKGLKIIKEYLQISALKWIYWVVFWIFSLSFFAARISVIPTFLRRILSVTGYYWLAFILYTLLIVCLLDIIRLGIRHTRFFSNMMKHKHAALVTGIFVVLVVASIVVYGVINADNPVIKHYDVSIDKQADIKSLHAAMVSDMHLDEIRGKSEVDRFIKQVKEISPDILFLDGDIIVEDTDKSTSEYFADEIGKLKLKYGIYAVTGNHEYIGGKANEYELLLSSKGVKVLRDKVTAIDQSIYIIGREDLSYSGESGRKRIPLNQLTSGVDMSKPLILLDHQPNTIGESESSNIDIQLSGHTHKGQMFPFNIITGLQYKLDYGMLKESNYNLIVSSGYGTWGPPIRTGNRPEIVDIDIKFK